MFYAIKLIFISLLFNFLTCRSFIDIKNDLKIIIEENNIELSDTAEIDKSNKKFLDGHYYAQFTEGFCLNRLNSILDILIKFSSQEDVFKIYPEELKNFELFCDYENFKNISLDIIKEIESLNN